MNDIDRSAFIHPEAIVENGAIIGAKTRIWAFAHVLPGATIGENCNICDHTFIENEVVIGNNVTIKCGVYLWNGTLLENFVFIGPNVTFTNDKYPRSKQYPEVWGKILIEEGASIGANATILPGVCIGKNAMVGAGAVVTNNVPANAKVVGNPAKIVGYVDTTISPYQEDQFSDSFEHATGLGGVSVFQLPNIIDLRGNLSVGELEKHFPFTPKRYFLVYNVPSAKVRGEHAHKKCQQFMVCVKGQVSVVADNGEKRQEYLLNQPNIGIYIPPMVWAVQYKYSQDAVLLVLASHTYDPDDYIRDYNKYLEMVKTGHTKS